LQLCFKTWCDEKKVKETVTEKVRVACFVNKAKQQKSPTLWSGYKIRKTFLQKLLGKVTKIFEKLIPLVQIILQCRD
jgi:hypothetical protein